LFLLTFYFFSHVEDVWSLLHGLSSFGAVVKGRSYPLLPLRNIYLPSGASWELQPRHAKVICSPWVPFLHFAVSFVARCQWFITPPVTILTDLGALSSGSINGRAELRQGTPRLVNRGPLWGIRASVRGVCLAITILIRHDIGQALGECRSTLSKVCFALRLIIIRVIGERVADIANQVEIAVR
jgi:hypothetical protein